MPLPSDRLLAGGLVLAALFALIPAARLLAGGSGERLGDAQAAGPLVGDGTDPATRGGQGAGTELPAVPSLALPSLPGLPRRALLEAAEALGRETRSRTLRVSFAGERLDLDHTRLEVSPLWREGGGLRATEGFSLRLERDDVVGYQAGGEQFELEIGSLFRFAQPDSLLLRASSEALTGLEVLPCGSEDQDHFAATLWMDAGTPVTGRVAPAEGGQLGAFLVLGGQPINPPVVDGVVRSDGDYELRLPGGHEYALCILGPGERPATLRFGVGFGGRQHLPTTYMPVGEVIGGGLALMKTCERATVTATLAGGAGHFSVGTHDFVWYEQAFEWRSRSTRPYDLRCDGGFLLTGLAPGTYELSVSGVVHSDRVAVGRVPSILVRAPSAGVDLAPRLARVRLRLERDGEPVSDGGIPLIQDFGPRGTSHLQARTSPDGTAEFWLDPEAPAWIRGRESTRFLPSDLDGAAPRAIQAGQSGGTVAGF